MTARATTTVAPETDREITAETPCCGRPVTLRFPTYAHKGYPRADEPTFMSWPMRCEGCGQWREAFIDVRYRRSYEIGWVTRRRPFGPLLWDSVD